MRSRLLASVTALGETMRNRDLRRAQASFAASWTSEWALTVIVGVVAYKDGGAGLVGIVAALRMALPALISPFASALADRVRRDIVLIYAGLVRSLATALAALLLAVHAPMLGFYVLIILGACAFILVRSANSALVPLLCRSPLELTSAMASRGLLDSGSTFVGPLLAALLLGVSTSAVAVLAVALLSGASSVVLLGLTYEAPARAPVALSLHNIATEATEGFVAMAAQRDVAVLVALALVQTFIRGCLTVFVVVLAFTVLHAGETGVGVLTAAIGAGATAGSLLAFSLVSGRWLATVGGAGVSLWGLPLVVTSAVSSTPAIVALMAVIGIGNSLLDFGYFTLWARLVPERLLGRFFGSFESIVALAVAFGSLVAPLLIDRLGLRGALLLVGLIAPAAVLLASPRLLYIDRTMGRRDAEIDVLRSVGMFRPLPIPVIDHLAVVVSRAHVDAGADVFHQGDEGDCLYVIEHGSADVIGDGRLVRRLQPGECFGEVALLNSSPRTATVRAHTELDLYTLDRADFLLAVTGCSATGQQAQLLLQERLATFTPGAAHSSTTG